MTNPKKLNEISKEAHVDGRAKRHHPPRAKRHPPANEHDPGADVCKKCGTEKSCGCTAPYVSATERAMQVIKRNPGKSNLALAKKTAISEATFRRARDHLKAQENIMSATNVAPKKLNGISVFRQQLNPASQNAATSADDGIDISGHINTKTFQMKTQPLPPWPTARDNP